MSLTRKVLRRGPRVVQTKDGVVPALGQHSKLLRIRPLDVIYRRLMARALASRQTRHGQ